MSDFGEIEEIKKKEKKEETLSDKLRVLLENEELTEKMLKEKPQWLRAIGDNKPMSVITGSLIAEGMKGDKRAIELINKIAYGDQVTINAGQGFFDSNEIKIEIVNPEHKKEQNNEDFEETV